MSTASISKNLCRNQKFLTGFTPLEIRSASQPNKVPRNHRGNQRFLTGFTLIELLIVVAIIGLLTSILIVSFGTARIRARDTKRVNDMTQVRTGLDNFLGQVGGYPSTAIWNVAVGGTLSCDGINFLQVPRDPLVSYSYTYTGGGPGFSGCGDTLYPTYKIQFQTEDTTSLGPVGTYWLSPVGFSNTEPF